MVFVIAKKKLLRSFSEGDRSSEGLESPSRERPFCSEAECEVPWWDQRFLSHADPSGDEWSRGGSSSQYPRVHCTACELLFSRDNFWAIFPPLLFPSLTLQVLSLPSRCLSLPEVNPKSPKRLDPSRPSGKTKKTLNQAVNPTGQLEKGMHPCQKNHTPPDLEKSGFSRSGNLGSLVIFQRLCRTLCRCLSSAL